MSEEPQQEGADEQNTQQLDDDEFLKKLSFCDVTKLEEINLRL